MRLHTADTDTITVEEKVYDYGDRSINAQINDDHTVGLRLFQSGDFASESVHLHLNEAEPQVIEVSANTYKGDRHGDRAWATLTLGGRYENDKGQRCHRESKVYLTAANLVEIRDELTREIRRARSAGHIA